MQVLIARYGWMTSKHARAFACYTVGQGSWQIDPSKLVVCVPAI
jgi:hypothetical protein